MNRILSFTLAAFALAIGAQAQTALTTTTTSAAITDTRNGVIAVASGTNFTAGNMAYVDKEAMRIVSVNGTLISVVRGTNQTPAATHASGAAVYTGSPSAFTSANVLQFSGTCTAAGTFAPTIDVRNGDAFYCLNGGWQRNPYTSFGAGVVSSAVASAAGLITPSGSVFHVTGTSAITGFTLPTGFVASASQGGFCAIPDAIFTTTTANNIALASTAVVGKLLCWKYDPGTNKFYPSY